jgi:hypothetical protein
MGKYSEVENTPFKLFQEMEQFKSFSVFFTSPSAAAKLLNQTSF